MANVSGNSQASLSLTQIVTSGVVTQQNLPANINQTITYSNGTGAGAIDLLYAKQLSLAGTATTLDLTSLTDLSGASINFARVRFIWIFNLATTAGYTITVGNAASNAFTGFLSSTGTAVCYPGSSSNYGRLIFEDPNSTGGSVGAVTGGSNKNLKLDPGANTISCFVVIGGCSATS